MEMVFEPEQFAGSHNFAQELNGFGACPVGDVDALYNLPGCDHYDNVRCDRGDCSTVRSSRPYHEPSCSQINYESLAACEADARFDASVGAES